MTDPRLDQRPYTFLHTPVSHSLKKFLRERAEAHGLRSMRAYVTHLATLDGYVISEKDL